MSKPTSAASRATAWPDVPAADEEERDPRQRRQVGDAASASRAGAASSAERAGDATCVRSSRIGE